MVSPTGIRITRTTAMVKSTSRMASVCLVKWDFQPKSPYLHHGCRRLFTYYFNHPTSHESHISDGMTGHGGSKPLKIIAVTGGNGSQGTDYDVLWYNTSTQTGYIYNTLTGIITDTSGHQQATGLPSNYHIHQSLHYPRWAICLDTGGRDQYQFPLCLGYHALNRYRVGRLGIVLSQA